MNLISLKVYKLHIMTKRQVKHNQLLEFCNRVKGGDDQRTVAIIYGQIAVAIVGILVVGGLALYYHTPLALWGLVAVGVMVKVIGE